MILSLLIKRFLFQHASLLKVIDGVMCTRLSPQGDRWCDALDSVPASLLKVIDGVMCTRLSPQGDRWCDVYPPLSSR